MRTVYCKNREFLFVSTDKILCYNLENGTERQIQISTPMLPRNQKAGNVTTTAEESKHITSLDFSRTNEFIAVSTSNKWVVIYNNNFDIVKSFVVNRVASKVCFTLSNDIVVADKTGDVYLYKFSGDNIESTCLLGHRSMILDMILTKCGKYIITCDRDEKIRVSHFPNAYNIVSFCLGHSQFVINISVVENVLVSASGDGTVRFWDFLKGHQLASIDTNSYITDCDLLNQFVKRIVKEKVEIQALPIADMQTYFDKENLYVAVSIHGYSAVLLFKTELRNFSVQLLATFNMSEPFSFLLIKHLYSFSNSVSIEKYRDASESNTDLNLLQSFYSKYQNMININDDNEFISLLYKRKFDNVKEYMDRKKQRLEIK